MSGPGCVDEVELDVTCRFLITHIVCLHVHNIFSSSFTTHLSWKLVECVAESRVDNMTITANISESALTVIASTSHPISLRHVSECLVGISYIFLGCI